MKYLLMASLGLIAAFSLFSGCRGEDQSKIAEELKQALKRISVLEEQVNQLKQGQSAQALPPLDHADQDQINKRLARLEQSVNMLLMDMNKIQQQSP